MRELPRLEMMVDSPLSAGEVSEGPLRKGVEVACKSHGISNPLGDEHTFLEDHHFLSTESHSHKVLETSGQYPVPPELMTTAFGNQTPIELSRLRMRLPD